MATAAAQQMQQDPLPTLRGRTHELSKTLAKSFTGTSPIHVAALLGSPYAEVRLTANATGVASAPPGKCGGSSFAAACRMLSRSAWQMTSTGVNLRQSLHGAHMPWVSTVP